MSASSPSRYDSRDFVLHVLRNPHGWDEEVVRAVRSRAADMLEADARIKHTVLHSLGDLLGALTPEDRASIL